VVSLWICYWCIFFMGPQTNMAGHQYPIPDMHLQMLKQLIWEKSLSTLRPLELDVQPTFYRFSCVKWKQTHTWSIDAWLVSCFAWSWAVSSVCLCFHTLVCPLWKTPYAFKISIVSTLHAFGFPVQRTLVAHGIPKRCQWYRHGYIWNYPMLTLLDETLFDLLKLMKLTETCHLSLPYSDYALH